MRYKTTIEIITEAENKRDATDIAGEYLSGNITSGVSMKCGTRPFPDYVKGLTVSLVAVLLFASAFISAKQMNGWRNSGLFIAGQDAIQPALSTSPVCSKNPDFKKDWEARQDKAILDYIKK